MDDFLRKFRRSEGRHFPGHQAVKLRFTLLAARPLRAADPLGFVVPLLFETSCRGVHSRMIGTTKTGSQ
jgi:hypothetical protein